MNKILAAVDTKRFKIALWIFNVLAWSWIFYSLNWIIIPHYETIKYTKVVSVTGIVLPKPIDLGIEFEYCILPLENIDPVSQFNAGTPVPYESVPISTQMVNEPISTSQVGTIPSQIGVTPSVVPTVPIPTQVDYLNLKVIKVGNFNKDNFHFVLVGVGYEENNSIEMQKIIDNFNENFVGINADFAYVELSLNLDFKHIQQLVNFENESDQEALFDAIKRVYPVDGLVIAINTPLFLGTSHGNAAMLTSNDPNTIIIATHEIGHQLGLDDGYQAFYGESRLPSTELFFIDEMPSRLVSALKKMDSIPSLYKVGTCNNKSVYSFYESNNNIMRDYGPSEIKSWGTTIFTPLQIILMNDYIAWYKEVYK